MCSGNKTFNKNILCSSFNGKANPLIMLSGKKIVIIHNIHHCTACMKILESIAFFFFKQISCKTMQQKKLQIQYVPEFLIQLFKEYNSIEQTNQHLPIPGPSLSEVLNSSFIRHLTIPAFQIPTFIMNYSI